MLEDVFDLRKGRLFVDKFCRLEMRKLTVEFFFRLCDDVLEETQRKFSPEHGERLQQNFFFWRQAVDAGSEDALDGSGKVEVRWVGARRAAPLRRVLTLFTQRLHDLFHEEWVAFGFFQDELRL